MTTTKESDAELDDEGRFVTRWVQIDHAEPNMLGEDSVCYGCCGEVPIRRGTWALDAIVLDRMTSTEQTLHFCQRCAVMIQRKSQRNNGRYMGAEPGQLRWAKLARADKDYWEEVLKLAQEKREKAKAEQQRQSSPPSSATAEESKQEKREEEQKTSSPSADELERRLKKVKSLASGLKKRTGELAVYRLKLKVAAAKGEPTDGIFGEMLRLKDGMEESLAKIGDVADGRDGKQTGRRKDGKGKSK